ncbi:cytochrome c oxidase subunit 8B, mitochondrial [Cynoglossus semilaevis]|uniref:Cytochrome c oxidase subunit 8B, mitochondrial n=1 Tax=Cynoglossus semilaevis TaxID=244447 RepID=A0A3P8UZ59_CYNSE|nr:cytochrome c oxidase subunit 8B, mitochondrial [Cynoglossus semilaevis]
MPIFQRMFASRVAQTLRQHNLTQRANITGKPAKENIAAVETAVGLGLFTVVILGPAGWVLSHLEDYKKRE